jgi:hypothetical protein
MIKPEWAGFMIAGSFGRYLAQTARDHGSGVGSGLRARRLGREQRLRFQGLAARRSLIKAAPMCHRSGLSNGWTTRKVVYPRYRRLPAVRG